MQDLAYFGSLDFLAKAQVIQDKVITKGYGSENNANRIHDLSFPLRSNSLCLLFLSFGVVVGQMSVSGKVLGAAIAEALEKPFHSLAHGLLAALPVTQVNFP